jgi:hypothetical protein
MQSDIPESIGSRLASVAVIVLLALDVFYMAHVWG